MYLAADRHRQNLYDKKVLNFLETPGLYAFFYCMARKSRTCSPEEKARLRSYNSARSVKSIANNFWVNAALTADIERCWIWQRRIGANGYGGVRIGGKIIEAHRYAFFLTFGYWPIPMCLHSCDMPPCINPNHLREGGQVENMGDMRKRGRQNNGRKSFG